jgi:hypothetical protein
LYYTFEGNEEPALCCKSEEKLYIEVWWKLLVVTNLEMMMEIDHLVQVIVRAIVEEHQQPYKKMMTVKRIGQ